MSSPDDGGFAQVLRSMSSSTDGLSPLSAADELAAAEADEKAGAALLTRLEAMEGSKRVALSEAEKDHSAVCMRVAAFHTRLLAKHSRLAGRERLLLSHSGQLLKSLRTEESRVKTLSTTVQRINQQRKGELAKISEPGWAVPHHYHMTSMEHALGHTQPHVLDVGSMIRGHLRLYAIASATVRFQKNASHVLGKAKAARVRVSSQIKKVYKELRQVRAHMKQLEQVMNGMRETVGGAKEMQALEARLRKQGAEAQAAAAAAAAALDAEGVQLGAPATAAAPAGAAGAGAGAATSGGDFSSGRDLLRPAPEESDSDEEDGKEEGRGRGQRRSSIGEEPIDSPNAVRLRHGPAAPPRFAQPDSPRPTGAGGRLGPRNIKMRFFQALHLTPPALAQAARSEAAEDKRKESRPSSPGLGAAASPAGTASPSVEESEAAGERRAAEALSHEFHLTKSMKQTVWEALETIVSRREQLRYALSERRQSQAETGAAAADADAAVAEAAAAVAAVGLDDDAAPAEAAAPAPASSAAGDAAATSDVNE